ncbi:MAG: SUMF1/EgtB/PvdO family nonheme iron enzyme [Magnetococcus sp. YQC-9]
MPQDHRNALPSGYRFHEYRIDGVLGVGGFGITYLGWDESLRQQVAIKEYLPNEIAVREGATVYAKSEKEREDFEWGRVRFVEEARTLVNFHHTNIVRVYRLVENLNNTAYMVMGYEDGASLEALLSRQTPPYDEKTLLGMVFPLLDGLEEVHRAGFLHRDIKPGNIYIRRRDESPVLLDFGSARQALGGKRSRSLSVVVSVGYAPIEQYESDPKLQKAYTDIYALGAVLYRAIGGGTPVDSMSRSNAVYIRKQKDPLTPALVIGKGRYSEGFLRAIDHALSIRETDRPQSVAAWREAFKGNFRTRPRVDRKVWMAVGLAVLLGLGGWLWQSERERSLERAHMEVARQEKESLAKRQEQERQEKERLEAERKKNLAVAPPKTQVNVAPLHECDRQAAYWDNPHVIYLDPIEIHADRALPACREAIRQYPEELRFQMQLARAVLKSGDRKDAAEKMRQLAVKGYAPAQDLYADHLVHGLGVAKDEAEAVQWMQRSAQQGYGFVYASLGKVYWEGIGVMKDQAASEKWYRKTLDYFRRLAEQGNASGQVMLGVLYIEGRGVEKNDKEAVKWFRKAAAQGAGMGQSLLGHMYVEGKGVEKDAKEALKWFNKAVEQGHAMGYEGLALMYANGLGVEKDEKKAVELYRRTAAQESSVGQVGLGGMYARGAGVEKDDYEAVKWFRKAVEYGNAGGQVSLGVMYAEGRGVAKDEQEAVRWYRKSAEQGSADGQFFLGVMLANGQGVKENDTEAVKWLRKSAEQGHSSGQFNLGVMYEQGRGVEKNVKEALKWYRKAAEQGHEEAKKSEQRLTSVEKGQNNAGKVSMGAAKIEFVRVPGGTFQMGCGSWQSDCFDNEKPSVEVSVGSFEIGKYEVTNGQYMECVQAGACRVPVWNELGSEYHYQTGTSDWYKKLGEALTGNSHPVVGVSWENAQQMVKWLNGRGDGCRYRLPTEAEWEYACRSGGKPEKYCGGNDMKEISWYDKNSGGKTHPVGQKLANGFGIHDMSGNVYEWTCSDWGKYGDGGKNFALCNQAGSSRVARGGGWFNSPTRVRSANRYGAAPTDRHYALGFRLARGCP